VGGGALGSALGMQSGNKEGSGRQTNPRRAAHALSPLSPQEKGAGPLYLPVLATRPYP